MVRYELWFPHFLLSDLLYVAVLHCDSHPCGRGATCLETAQGFQCLCPPGWTGKTCQIGKTQLTHTNTHINIPVHILNWLSIISCTCLYMPVPPFSYQSMLSSTCLFLSEPVQSRPQLFSLVPTCPSPYLLLWQYTIKKHQRLPYSLGPNQIFTEHSE